MTYTYRMRVKCKLMDIEIPAELYDEWLPEYKRVVKFDKKAGVYYAFGMSDRDYKQLLLHYLANRIINKYNNIPKWVTN